VKSEIFLSIRRIYSYIFVKIFFGFYQYVRFYVNFVVRCVAHFNAHKLVTGEYYFLHSHSR